MLEHAAEGAERLLAQLTSPQQHEDLTRLLNFAKEPACNLKEAFVREVVDSIVAEETELDEARECSEWQPTSMASSEEDEELEYPNLVSMMNADNIETESENAVSFFDKFSEAYTPQMIATTPSHLSPVSTIIPNRVTGKPVSQKELRKRMGLDDDKEPRKKAEKRKSNSKKSKGKKFTKKAKKLFKIENFILSKPNAS